MKRRSLLACIAASAALGAATGMRPSAAQSRYPERPIRLVVPFAPGGETDLIGRLWAQHTAPLLGQSIVIENKGGGGGSIGATEVARARPDGYTLLTGTSGTHVVNPLASSKPAFDPIADFIPVTLVSVTPFTVTVHPGVPARTLQELIALIKAAPGKYAYASAGAGTMAHLAGEMFRMQAGDLDLQHVPYKGAGPGMQDMIAGHIPMGMTVLTSGLQAHHRAGKLRILAVSHEMRVPAVPDIPTAAESGMPGLKVGVFNGIFAPAGTPAPVIDALHQATQRAFHDGALRRDLEKAGAQALMQSTPQWAAAFLTEEIRRWTPVVRAAGIRME